MRISPIILFSVDFIIYAIFDEDLSQDLSARLAMPALPSLYSNCAIESK